MIPPHGFYKDPPGSIVLHPVPDQVSLSASPSRLPELSLQDRHGLDGPDQHDRKSYGIDQRHKEVEHLIRPAAFRLAQVLDLINDKDADLELPHELGHDDQEHLEGIPALRVLRKIVCPGRYIHRMEELVAELFQRTVMRAVELQPCQLCHGQHFPPIDGMDDPLRIQGKDLFDSRTFPDPGHTDDRKSGC